MLESKQGKDQQPYSPALHTWSPVVSIIADLIDEIRGLRQLTLAANSKKGTKLPEVKPYPRPRTAVEKMRSSVTHKTRQQKHQELVARVLPKKAAE